MVKHSATKGQQNVLFFKNGAIRARAHACARARFID